MPRSWAMRLSHGRRGKAGGRSSADEVVEFLVYEEELSLHVRRGPLSIAARAL